MTRKLGIAALFALTTLAAQAHEYTVKNLFINHPWARATPPGAETGGVYFSIKNNGGTAETLLAADSPVAAKVDFHSMTTSNNMMKMRNEASLDIPAHGELKLAPGGYHIMLQGLKQPLKVKDSFPLTLHFKNTGDVVVKVVIQDMGSGGASDDMGGMKM